MLFRVVVPFLLPAGVNPPELPDVGTLVPGARLAGRSELATPVRVEVSPEGDSLNWTSEGRSGGIFFAGGSITPAEVGRIASRLTTMRTITLIVDGPATARDALRRGYQALESRYSLTSGKVLASVRVEVVPARAGSGWGALIGLVLLGGVFWAARSERAIR